MQKSSASLNSNVDVARPAVPFEEKFVHTYKNIFQRRSLVGSRKDTGIQGHAALTRFWDELLLLKVNEGFLVQCISSSNEAQLQTELKPVVSELFGTCSLYLDDGNFIRVAHSLETLIIMFQEIFKKRFVEQGSMIITLIAGSIENADTYFSKLINRVANLLKRDDVPIPIKALCLRLYFSILTTTDNINTNVIASYFFQNNIFSAILAAITVKLTEDRRCLELDATLVLLLLLLWRESDNIYTKLLSSSSLPLVPFLQTAYSLLSFKAKCEEVSFTSSSFQLWSLHDVVSLFGNYFGLSSTLDSKEGADKMVRPYSNSSKETATSHEEFWLYTTAGAVLTYFLFYLSPLMKSNQVWQPSIDRTFQGSATVAQSISTLWNQLIKQLLSSCEASFSHLSKAQPIEMLQAKCYLNTLRCLLEAKESLEYLALCDADDFSLRPAPNGVSGLPYTIPFRSVLCAILEYVAQILKTNPVDPLDPDLFSRAALLVPLSFSSLKLHGWQLSPDSLKWLHLWESLMHVCEWVGKENYFQRPGAPELADLGLGIIESCLGNSQDICSAPEASEYLHATVMAHMDDLDRVVRTAALTSSRNKSSSQLINIASLKLHYEVQIAAMGIRGRPTYEQALQAVQKKGLASLKLKPRHAGPTHCYAEGTAEHRILINTTRLLVAVRRKQPSNKASILKPSTLDTL